MEDNAKQWPTGTAFVIIQAAAFAANGDFTRASELAGKAEEKARTDGHGDLANWAATHKKLYVEVKPFRQGKP